MKARHLFCLTLIVVACVAAASVDAAQAPPASNRASIEKQIVAAERAVNEAVAKGDVKTFHANVASDGIDLEGNGVNKVNAPEFDKMITSAKIESWNIDNSQFYWVSDNAVVHMYRWTGKGTFSGQPVQSPTWASTIWANKGGKWLAVFHQETPAMATPAPAAAKPSPAPAKK
jgi:hypothetical protein